MFSALYKKLCLFLGNLKVFSYPFWLVYDPDVSKLTGKDFDQISLKLRKYDVLLRRCDDYWFSVNVPGFWSHASVCIGHNADINKDVVHASEYGVVAETLFDYMKIADHIVVLRPKFVSPGFKKRLDLLKDRKYDFNFDSKNEDEVFCTEFVNSLLFVGEDKIPYKSEVLEINTLFPDDFYSSDRFEVILEIRHER